MKERKSRTLNKFPVHHPAWHPSALSKRSSPFLIPQSGYGRFADEETQKPIKRSFLFITHPLALYAKKVFDKSQIGETIKIVVVFFLYRRFFPASIM